MYPSKRRQTDTPPALNVPPVVLVLAGLLVGIHILLAVLPAEWRQWSLLHFAFIPARYGTDSLQFGQWPGGYPADIWTLLTNAFIQPDGGAVLINVAALLVLGAAVAWRLGTRRFLGFAALCAIAGALTCLVVYWGQAIPIMGAGPALSGMFAAAIHFVFKGGSALAAFQFQGGAGFRKPAWTLMDALADQNVRLWLAIFAFINLWYLIAPYLLPAFQEFVPWPGNIGGFVAGLLLFRYFDPRPRLRRVV